MEQRLIDADALCERPLYFVGDEVFVNIKAVENAPTIDAVPVVRCKECVWRHDDSSPIWLPCMSKDTDDDWFCADGERRTE